MKILVTGCGGDIGQSIGKILNKQKDILVSGCDISDENAGKFIFDEFFIGVACNQEGYLDFLKNYINKNNIDLIIPMAEPELRFLSKKKVLNNIGQAKLITASTKALEIGFDKLKTAQFLEENKMPFPKTMNISAITRLDFPVILKSKTGSGSSDVYLVKTQKDFEYLKEKHPDFVVQEFINAPNNEYTCGLYRSSKGEIRSIILKRKLTGGYSGYGEVIHNKEITTLLIKIAKKLNLLGSINVQLRLSKKGPIVFEINPRFSSTVLFRHLFGFKDLLWSIEDVTGKKISPYTPVAAGRKFYKGFNEFID
jgi:carbamoyl-phosphate synthase large subunit